MGGSAAKLMCRDTELVDPNLNRFRMHQDVETRPGSMRCSLLQFSGDLFGVLLMPWNILRPVCSRLWSSGLLADGMSVVSSAPFTVL